MTDRLKPRLAYYVMLGFLGLLLATGIAIEIFGVIKARSKRIDRGL